jgi:glycerophosphoryl diester phosphodiesterase
MALIMAHRGASGYAPENTMAAFEKALEMGTEGIELDVHMTADGEIVVIHDHTVDRTSDGKGMVGALTLEEIREFDFGSWFDPKFKGQSIPTLRDVFELLEDWEGLLNIEVKSGPIFYPGIEEKHVHDNDLVRDVHTLPFTQKIDWDEVMTALKDIGYDGELTFEADVFLSQFPDELAVHASRLMLEVGRYFIDKYEL